ncbi:unnamed protein product, partial [Trichogramma brassicae]
ERDCSFNERLVPGIRGLRERLQGYSYRDCWTLEGAFARRCGFLPLAHSKCDPCTLFHGAGGYRSACRKMSRTRRELDTLITRPMLKLSLRHRSRQFDQHLFVLSSDDEQPIRPIATSVYRHSSAIRRLLFCASLRAPHPVG